MADLMRAIGDEFDRWLVAHDAQVKAEAWDDGHTAGYFDAKDDGEFYLEVRTPNPYRRTE